MLLVDKINWRWEDLCGPDGLKPWDDVTKDLGLCFQQLFLDVPVLFFLAISSGFYIGYRKNWVVRAKTQETAVQMRSVVALCLSITPVVNLYILVSKHNKFYPIDFLVGGCTCLSWLVHFCYVLALKHRLGLNHRGPTMMLVWWSLDLLLSIMSLRSRSLVSAPIGGNIAVVVLHVLYFVTLLPEGAQANPTFYSPCLVGQGEHYGEYFPLLQPDDTILGTALQGVSYTSRLLFRWVEPLFKRGLLQKLNDPDDLFDLPAEYRCDSVGREIEKALIGNVDNFVRPFHRPVQPFLRSEYGAIGETSNTAPLISAPSIIIRSPKRHNISLFRALHRCFGTQFYCIGILKFVSDCAGFAGPLLLNKLITFIQDTTIDMHLGYVYALGLLATTIISALCNSHFNLYMSCVGIKMKAAIISTVLRKTLSVTTTELSKRFTLGEITNFMSTDTDRIVNSCPSFHALWSIPLQMFVSLYLLYQQVGIAFLAGIAFSILMIPLNKVIANKIGELSTKMMDYKDRRVNITSEMLKGIRTIKLHVWEDYFETRISLEREKELKYLKGRKYLDALCVVFWATTPVLVSVLTLSTYVLIGNTLDAATVFTAVALMNMLIAPLNAFPWVLNGLTEAWVSVRRIQRLLELSEIDRDHYYDRINTNKDEDSVLVMRNATFTWAQSIDKPIPTQKQSKIVKGKSSKGKHKGYIQRKDSTSSGERLVQSEPFSLHNLSLTIQWGQLIGVVGKVGSGKTSLLNSIIAEMLKKDGELQISDTISGFAYVSQKPWLQRGTIRQNILFGKTYDETKFKAVIEACGLSEDMETLGWNAVVGEGGCTLSGGQRARVALARAVYQDKQVYLLDDIFSAVDTKVASHIFRACVLGLLGHKTRILVTHSIHFLAQANTIVLMEDGRIKKKGPPDITLSELMEMDDVVQSDSESYHEGSGRHSSSALTEQETVSPGDDADNTSVNSHMKDEDLTTGSIGWWVIGMYLRSVGSFLAASVLLSVLLMQISQNVTFLWLSYWVSSETHSNTTNLSSYSTEGLYRRSYPDDVAAHENKTVLDHAISLIDEAVHKAMESFSENSEGNGTSISNITSERVEDSLSRNTVNYLTIYLGLAVLNFAFTSMRAFLFAHGGVQAAKKIHKALLKVVLQAKMKFFDLTPVGRILNRFSSDTYTVDDSLPFILNILLAQVFGLMGSLAVAVYGLPWLCVILVPLVPLYHRLQHRYRLTSRQLKRLHSITLSPIYSHFADTLEGMTTIRAFCNSERSMATAEELVDLSQRATLASAAAAQWLSLRLQCMGVGVITGAAAVAVAQRHFGVADPGLVGLAISYALSVTGLLSGVMNAFPETERELVAVERVGQYVRDVKPERRGGSAGGLYGWPSQGVVCLHHVTVKYSERTQPALIDVSLETRPAEKLGVVGRTGAGKSSLFSALLRLVELHSGAIFIDSVDISTLSLNELRSRVAVIPQDPFIFTGTVRENLDPLGQYMETELWLALDKCGARGAVQGRGGLDGEALGLSQGHMQLLCLARAILQNAKILCIDEATANVDTETDRLIQDTIRCSFRRSTVITIAHRISTVLDCDRVLVMGEGKVLELDSPDALLNNPQSHFYRLVHSHDS